MAIVKKGNLLDQINEYNNDFINSITFKNIKDSKDLKELLAKLEKANEVVTEYYSVLYNDYITMINSKYCFNSNGIDLDTVIKYRSITKKIQKMYNYVVRLTMFENPFKSTNK